MSVPVKKIVHGRPPKLWSPVLRFAMGVAPALAAHSAFAQSVGWVQRNVSGLEAQSHFQMVYDAALDRTIRVFGFGDDGRTRLWNGVEWEEQSSGVVQNRTLPGAAYD